MKWNYLFSSRILERGRKYYKNGQVQDLHQEGSTYYAEVIGSVVYHVTAHALNRFTPVLSCDCPYAADGHRCKHMAAVLYAIDEQYDSSNAVKNPKKVKKTVLPKPVHPFQTPEDGEYRYFDMARMTEEFTFLDTTCEKAREMISSGKISLQNVNFGYGYGRGGQKIQGKLVARLEDDWGAVLVEVDFSRDKILTTSCHAIRCYQTYNGIYSYISKNSRHDTFCVHTVAALFLLNDYLKENNPGDTTDRNALLLLDQYREKHAHRVIHGNEKRECVVLEPRLERDFYEWKLSFRIGTEKMYVAKNLSELVDCVEREDTLTLGKKSEIAFAGSCFTAESQPYYDFVRKCVLGERQRLNSILNTRQYYYDDEREIKGNIPLFGERLDTFFSLAEGRTLLLTDKTDGVSRKSVVTLAPNDPKIVLTVEPDGGGESLFEGVCVRGDLPEVVRGADYFYYVEDENPASVCLNRISDEFADKLKPLMKIQGYDGVLFRIGRRSLAEFYYTILPVLRESFEVREVRPEQVETFLPPEVAFVFYLDAEDNNIICRPVAKYGETECHVTDWIAGIPNEPFRDGNRELEAMHFVIEYFPAYDPDEDVFHCDGDEERVYKVLESGIETLLGLGEVQSTERFRRLKIHRQPKISVGVSVKSDIMELSVLSDDLTQEELKDILFGYKRKKKYYRLKNGDFLKIEDDGIEELAAMVEAMHVKPKDFAKGHMQIPIYRALYLDKMLEQSAGVYANRDKHFKQLVKEFKTVGDSDFEVPESLQGIVRNYQKFGYKWLRTLESYGFGGVLADDMGLGKTLQMISVLLAAKEEGKDGTSLVVAPASLVYNWQEEFARFAPQMKVCTVVGTQTERREKIAHWRDWDVLVTSYDLLKRDVAEYEDKSFFYQVIDEAQYIKNHSTAAAKSVKVIRSRTKFALTGTPIENRLSELWSIFDFLMPGFLYEYEVFRRELETPIAKSQDEDATERLKRMVSPFILRRLKKDVLRDLPEKIEEVRYARMEKKQQHVYDGQVVHMRQMIEQQDDADFKKNKLQILAELTRIRQICCDPSLILANYDGESAKREACMDLIMSAIEGEHKMLVFSQFTSMLELLEGDLKKGHVNYFKITGQTPKKERLQMVRRFNEDETPVFLISLKAGGVGLNLTGADVVIHYDPWWNLAVQNQATDRAHRIGQTRAVAVYKLIVKDSIEEKILHMQEAKKNLADEILSGDLGGISSMSREELLALI